MNTTTYAVSGASGGLGVSTFAVHLAAHLARAGRAGKGDSAPVVLIDGDPEAGAIDVMAGVEHLPGLRWSDLASLSGAADGPRMLASLPQRDGVSVLSGDGRGGAPPDVMREVIDALRTVSHAVVIDEGRCAPQMPERAAPTRHLLLAGIGVRQLVDLERASALLGDRGERALGACAVRVISRGPRSRAGLGERVAAHVGREWVGHWPDERRWAVAVERGASAQPRLPRALRDWIDLPAPVSPVGSTVGWAGDAGYLDADKSDADKSVADKSDADNRVRLRPVA